MKAKTVIGILLIVGFTSVLFMNFGQQVGGYMNFEQATAAGTKAHVVGVRDDSQPVAYDATTNIFRFHMADDQGAVREVQYPHPKPANFEDAEKLVVEGYVKDEIFVAENILVKCPSKYNDARDLQETLGTSGS
jgi:cytochrome c-type biogenesis protein CcmE